MDRGGEREETSRRLAPSKRVIRAERSLALGSAIEELFHELLSLSNDTTTIMLEHPGKSPFGMRTLAASGNSHK